MPEDVTLYRGLDGVHIDASSISSIDGLKGELIYRGYDITELADKASYEEVTYLLWHDDLPTDSELAAFKASLKPHFEVRSEVLDLFKAMPKDIHPMHALRTAVSALAAFDDEADGLKDDNVRRIGA